jgi:hypothetical protein
MYSESSSPSTESAETILQNIDTEGKDFVTRSGNSRTPSPDTMLAGTRSEWLPTVVRSGYFVFPDPFSSGQRTSSSPQRIRSYAATSSEDEDCTTEGESETEDYRSTPPESVLLEQGNQQDSAPQPPKKETDQFLPLLKDEPNYPRNPTLNRGLEKINTRLKRATSCEEERSTQSSKTTPILGIHPALRQAEMQPAVDNEALAALKAEVKQLKADVKALEQLATSRDNRQAEFLRHLGRNQDSLVGGWEQMRNELFQIKVAQERIRRRLNMAHSMDGRW